MFQDLHSLRELRDFTIALGDHSAAGFDCCLFDRPDDVECRITHLAVNPQAGMQICRALIPTGRILSVDNSRRIIRVDMTASEIIRATCHDPATVNLSPHDSFCTEDVQGCSVFARDGDSGTIVDFLVDTHHWNLSYFELDIGRKEVLVDPSWTNDIDAAAHRVMLDLPQVAITDAPEFKDTTVINPGYCEALYRHYTSRKYMH